MHVSGHASQEDLKLMISMVKPKYFVPVHGEYRMLIKHAELAEQLGISRDNIFVTEIGYVLEFTHQGARIADKVTSGRTLIDGLGIGDVGNIVLRDRRQLSQDGILIVFTTFNSSTWTIQAGPDIVTRGFVYARESELLLDEVKEITRVTVTRLLESNVREWAKIKNQIKDSVSKHLYDKTGRRPVIMPIFQEVK